MLQMSPPPPNEENPHVEMWGFQPPNNSQSEMAQCFSPRLWREIWLWPPSHDQKHPRRCFSIFLFRLYLYIYRCKCRWAKGNPNQSSIGYIFGDSVFYKSVSDQQGNVIGVIGDFFVAPNLQENVFFPTQKMDRNGGWVEDSLKNMSNLQVCLDVLATCVSIAHLMSLASFKCGGSSGNLVNNVLFGKLTSRRKFHLLQDSSRSRVKRVAILLHQGDKLCIKNRAYSNIVHDVHVWVRFLGKWKWHRIIDWFSKGYLSLLRKY